jgi:hypothetical protein
LSDAAEILSAELDLLSKKQINAVKDATFLGWQPGELELYNARRERINLLKRRLAAFGGDKPSVADVFDQPEG